MAEAVKIINFKSKVFCKRKSIRKKINETIKVFCRWKTDTQPYSCASDSAAADDDDEQVASICIQ